MTLNNLNVYGPSFQIKVISALLTHKEFLLNIQDVLSDTIPIIILSRYAFVILMILITISILFKFGTKNKNKQSLITIGSMFTTILVIITSYFFGIWVVKFSKYNELYGSIGTLLIMMFYIWINCMILLLGFELNSIISKLKNNKINN